MLCNVDCFYNGTNNETGRQKKFMDVFYKFLFLLWKPIEVVYKCPSNM
jgi:hypothetical protein